MTGKSVRWGLGLILVLTVGVALSARPVAATGLIPTIGCAVDNRNFGSPDTVNFFNADNDTFLASVTLDPNNPGEGTGDCSVSDDQSRAYIVDFSSQLWVVNLTTTPPELVGPPIPIPNAGEDTSLQQVGNFLLACDGSAAPANVAVIDPYRARVVSTFPLSSDCNSVDACSDGSVLITSNNAKNVRRLRIQKWSGVLVDTGDVLPLTDAPNNVTCSPDSKSGIVITRGTHTITSFTIPGLAPVNTRTLTGTGQGSTVVISRTAPLEFNRQVDGTINVFSFATSTGALGATPSFTIAGPAINNNLFFGMDQMALNPEGTKLYVGDFANTRIDVFDAATGAPITNITGGTILDPTGIAFRRPSK